ncbi:MAG TPA: MFS transporter [Blastocatellia bacterium]|nr:MFS transporter [Blastocatellia bacterium]
MKSTQKKADHSADTATADIAQTARRSWMGEVSRYQWLVLAVAWLGWVFDSMDGTLYSLVQKPSMTELMGPGASEATISFYSSAVFSATLVGWALGGVIFGVIADYIGRTKALVATILIYSLFTGLSAAADTWWQLAIFRFITGLGLGGEWAAGAALVAEVWPDRLRAKAGAILQSAAAFGYFFAAVINLSVGDLSWRYVYLVGALPAVFVLFIRMIVKEPEAWLEVRDRRRLARAEQASSDHADELRAFTLKQLFGPRLRRDTVVASLLSFVVLLALWGATMWIPAVVREIAIPPAGLDERGVREYLNAQASYAIMLLNGGALFGYLWFGPMADRFGRRAAFAFYFIGGVILFPLTFLLTTNATQVFVLLPLVGFFTLGITSGFPIYLPELFPTHVRTTGVGFCYNAGRIITAGGVFLTGYLVGAFGGSYAKAASAVSLVYILGLFLLVFARETRGRRLT